MSQIVKISAAGGGSAMPPVVNLYLANDTWTKPASSRYLGSMVTLLSGGQGGGSGRRGPAGTNRTGGSGGCGGGLMSNVWVPALSMPSTVAVTVGIGGVGGASVGTDSTNGSDGGAGTPSSFGSLVYMTTYPYGGKGGISATLSPLGYPSSAFYPASFPYASYPQTSQPRGASASAHNASNGGTSGIGVPSGGGGKGISSANVISTSGGQGGGMYSVYPASLTAGPTSGNGADNVFLYPISASAFLAVGIGTGGAGGQFDITTPIQAGNGGLYGTGGGGGYASPDGTNSGKGGDGAPGWVLVIDYYS